MLYISHTEILVPYKLLSSESFNYKLSFIKQLLAKQNMFVKELFSSVVCI